MTKTQGLDFSALDGLKKDSLSPKDWGLASLMIVIPLFLSFQYELFILIIFVGFFGFVVYCLAVQHKLRTHNQFVLEAFALENSFTYTSAFANDFKTDPGTLFTHGHSKKASHIFAGDFAGYPFTLFRYDYATSSGKSRRSYDAEVMELTLPRVLPHMVIDSLMKGDSFGGSVLPIAFDKNQKIELEGDFYKYFSLYAPDKYGISALTIIAPDAMEALMRNAALCDIEIVDNKLYFYWPKVADAKVEYEEIFRTVQAVLEEIGKKLSRGDIFAHASQAKVHTETNAQGVRLKKSGIKLVTVLVIIGYIGAQFLRFTEGLLGAVFGGVFTIVVLAGLLLLARRESNRRRLLRDLQTRYDNYHSVT
ncbi:MAG: hypothetical protein V4702_06265 [Patescibacteria group bacterium]